MMTREDEEKLDEAIIWWRSLARQELDRDGNAVALERARTYERTAEALELEKKTGVWHCVCCLKPREQQKHLRRA